MSPRALTTTSGPGSFPRVSGDDRVSLAQILEPAIFRLWDINGVVRQNVLVGD